MALFLGNIYPNTYFLGRVGDILLSTNVCMALGDFSTRAAAKIPLSACPMVAGFNGQFYDGCNNMALLVPPTLSGVSSLGNPGPVTISVTDQSSFYGRTPFSSSFLQIGMWAQSLGTISLLLSTGDTVALSSSVKWTNAAGTALTTGLAYSCSGSAGSFSYALWTMLSDGATGTNFYLYCSNGGGTLSALGNIATFPYANLALTTTISISGMLVYDLVMFPFTATPTPALTAVGLSSSASALQLMSPGLSAIDPLCTFVYATCVSCPSGSYLSNQHCLPCNLACQTCTGPTYSLCGACATGYYSQPGNPSLCLPQCPTGYTSTASQTCVLSSNPEQKVSFNDNLAGDWLLPSGIHVQLGWDPNKYYPDFDFLDPFPVRYRGVFYNVSESVNLPNLRGSVTQPLVLHSDFTVDMWVLPYSYGSLFRVNTNNGMEDNDLLVFGIYQEFVSWPNPTMQNVLSFGMQTFGNDFEFQASNIVLPNVKTEWYHVGFICKYDLTSDNTTVTLFKDTETFTFTLSSFFLDYASARHNIGFLCRYIAGFLGYIYAFQVVNVAYTMTQIFALRGSCPGCSVCPLSLNACLSTCGPLEYVDNTGNCKPCMSTCPYGCTRPDSCNLCDDQLCLKCSNFEAGSCSLCYPGASFVNGLCECDAGNFLMGNKCASTCDPGYHLIALEAKCVPCDNGCQTCSEVGCSLCVDGLYLENGQCSCGDGWFAASNSTCQKCSPVCQTCTSLSTSCTTCYTVYGYYPYNGACLDCRLASGYNGGLGLANVQTAGMTLSQVLNAVCQEICGDGRMMGQLQCDDGNLVNGDGCSSTCIVEHGWECTNIGQGPSVCVDKKPPEAILTYSRVTQTGYILVYSFTETVYFLQSLQILASVSITDTDLFTYNFTEIAIPGNLYSPYTLTITAEQSISAGRYVSVFISDTTQIQDAAKNQLVTQKVSVILPDSFNTPVSQGISTSMTGFGGFMGVLAALAIAGAILGGARLSEFWALWEHLQIVNFIVYMSVSFPDNLRAFLHGLQFSNFQFVPNFFTLYSTDTFSPPPESFVIEDVGTDFYKNYGSMIPIWAGLGLLFSILFILAKTVPNSKELLKLKHKFVWSVFLRFGIESFLVTNLSVFLQIRNPVPGGSQGYISVLTAFTALAYLTLTYYFTASKVTVQSITRLREKHHRRVFDTLYADFRLESKSTRSFLIVQNCRRFLYVLTLVFLSTSPIVQSVLIVLLTGFFTGSLLFFQPYKSLWSGNRVETICEFVLFISLGLIGGFASNQITEDGRNLLGWVVISLLTISISIHTLATLISLYRSLESLAKKCMRKLIISAAEKTRKTKGKPGLPSVTWGLDPTDILEGKETHTFRPVGSQPLYPLVQAKFQTTDDSRVFEDDEIHPAA